MRVAPSPHFSTVSLDRSFNAARADLPFGLRVPRLYQQAYGHQALRGMPFSFGSEIGANVVLLEGEHVAIDLEGAMATYVLFIHAVEDLDDCRATMQSDGQGYRIGDVVSNYELVYGDGSSHSTPILRRFAIQQARYGWGSAPFACVAAVDDSVLMTPDEAVRLRRTPGQLVELSHTRVLPGIYSVLDATDHGAALWIYALPNPRPDVPIRRIICTPEQERSAVHAVTVTDVIEHPLRPGVRRKLRLPVPDGVEINAIGEIDPEQIGIDLGVVISARAALEYDETRWIGEEGVIEPRRSDREVIVEYAAHPQALLHVGVHCFELGRVAKDLAEVGAAERPVRICFRDKSSGEPAAVRLHLHGAAGEYLAPRGHHRKVNRLELNHDHAPEFVNVENQYAYVDGECLVDLPLGNVFLEITCGFEIAPIRAKIEITPETDEVIFELKRVLRWRERGWITADTHVHFLSPQTALLEARAEGVNVVNLLATQWGEMHTNVGDFDGCTTFGANSLDGRGEFLVRVGSENRMQVLGHISLLGYTGQLIHPLGTGGPDESAFGDPLEVTMAEWARQCLDKGGLVVLPHAPTPQLERAADIVLGLVSAVELVTFNPLDPRGWALNVYGLADWYRYLNLGYQLPLVGGSDKMSAGMLLGGIRTYAHLGDQELTYENWMRAIRSGNTFVTIGPLVEMTVEGVAPGGIVHLPRGGGTLRVDWLVESLRVPVEAVEIVVGGVTADVMTVGDRQVSTTGGAPIPITTSTWIAVRVRGSLHGRPEDIAAHSSGVQIRVEGSEIFSEPDAVAVLEQIQGAIAYVDTIAPRRDGRRIEQLRASLETAYARLHQRMHLAGVYHRHPLHDPATLREH
jgi:hypothetical protein